MDYTVHRILQARILEWVAFLSFRGPSQPRNRTGVSCIAGGFFTRWATREYPKQTKTEKETCIPLFIAALFTITRTWKQPRCPLTDQFSSVQISPTVVSDSLGPHGLQHARLPCSAYSISCPLSQWCLPTISECRPLLLPPSIFPDSSLHQVAKVLEFQLQHQSFQWIFRTDFF